MTRVWFAFLTLLITSCGTYSMLRPAKTLEQGQWELNAGLSANSIGEVLPVAQVAAGVTDRVELLAQWEVYNAFVEGRVALLQPTRHGLGLTLGLGGGAGSTLISEVTDEIVNSGAVTGSAVLGRSWGLADLYLSNRTFLLLPDYVVSASRAGVRLGFSRSFRLIFEGGVTIHNDLLAVGEATIAIGTGF